MCVCAILEDFQGSKKAVSLGIPSLANLFFFAVKYKRVDFFVAVAPRICCLLSVLSVVSLCSLLSTVKVKSRDQAVHS